MLNVDLKQRKKRPSGKVKVRFPFVGISSWLFRPYDVSLGLYIKSKQGHKWLYPVPEQYHKVVYEKYSDLSELRRNVIVFDDNNNEYKINLFVICPAYIKKSILVMNDGKKMTESDYFAVICMNEREYKNNVERLIEQEVGNNKPGWWVIKKTTNGIQTYINYDILLDDDTTKCMNSIIGTDNECKDRIYNSLLEDIPDSIIAMIHRNFIDQPSHISSVDVVSDTNYMDNMDNVDNIHNIDDTGNIGNTDGVSSTNNMDIANNNNTNNIDPLDDIPF